jgi:hypothetical protein
MEEAMPPGSHFALDEARLLLRHTPQRLDAMVRWLPPRLIETDEGSETWSCLQVLQHLVWCEEANWVQRIAVLREHGGGRAFAPFDREEGFHRYAGRTAGQLLDEFATLRSRRLLELESMSLTAADLAGEGRHPTFGRVTLAQLIATWVTHDFAHLTQICRIVAKDAGRHAGPWRAFFSLLRDAS